MKERNTKLTKLRILAAAEKEFADKGIYGARVDEIARVAKTNKRMLYEYFGNKETLYKTTLYNVYNRLGEVEEKIISEDKGCLESIKDIIKVYFEFLVSNPNFVKMVMWENLNKAKYLEDVNAEHLKDPIVTAVHRIVQDGKNSGVFKENVDEDQIILALLTFSFSYFSNIFTLSRVLKMDLASPENIRKRLEYVTEVIVNQLLK